SGDMRVATLDLTFSKIILGDSASSHGSRPSLNIDRTMVPGKRPRFHHYASPQRWGIPVWVQALVRCVWRDSRDNYESPGQILRFALQIGV
ncbi:hypothetical protein, partial [Roseiconus nitratireducens]|uniref:hypothetical protein n=1 Tax=Roseiconus nitratireducens TaxID=2605748 RepID=UPI001F477F9F